MRLLREPLLHSTRWPIALGPATRFRTWPAVADLADGIRYLAATHDDKKAKAWAQNEVQRLDQLAAKEREISKLKTEHAKLQAAFESVGPAQTDTTQIRSALNQTIEQWKSTSTELTELRQQAGLDQDQAVSLPTPPPPPNPALVSLGEALSDDIARGHVSIYAQNTGVTIRVAGAGLFQSGDAELLPSGSSLVGRIGTALGGIPGNKVVVGHTDNVPIRSNRFSSNLALSQERADEIRNALIDSRIPAEDISAEGVGGNEPLAANDTAAGRALNRRMKIVLLSPE